MSLQPKNNAKASVKDMAQIALSAALIAACAFIIVPLPWGVHVSMQTFGVVLAGTVLGAKKGAAAVLVYIAIGLIGLPIFQGGVGGPAVLVGKSSGFLLSFPILAAMAGVGARAGNVLLQSAWLLLGTAVNYLCGVVMYCILHLEAGVSLGTVLAWFVVPFIAGDVLKFTMAVAVGRVAKRSLRSFGGFNRIV